MTVGDPNRKYTKMEQIGQGASGKVRLIRLTNWLTSTKTNIPFKKA